MSNANKKAPLVSIIVPVYGVEKYIRKCVQSLCDQSYSNIEILLVNDGSKDNCGLIIDEFTKTDDRIHVIHQENAGVSAARNHGLQKAQGDFVMFVDGDDYVESDYISYFMNATISYGVDMMVNTNNFTHTSEKKEQKENLQIWKDIDVIKGIYLGSIFVAVWNKLYRRSVLEQYNIRFHNDIWYGEGMLFNIEYLQFVDTILVGNRCVYHQVYNPGSAMRKFNLQSQICGMKSLDVQKKVWTKVTPEIERTWKYHFRNFSQSIICGLVSTNSVAEHRDLYRECVKNMRRDMLLPWLVKIPIGMKLRCTFFSIAPYLIALRRKRKADIVAEIQNERLMDNP